MIVDVEQLVEWKLVGETEVPARAPLYSTEIPHYQMRPRTRAAAVGSQRLTVWAMARPDIAHTFSYTIVLDSVTLERKLIIITSLLVSDYPTNMNPIWPVKSASREWALRVWAPSAYNCPFLFCFRLVKVSVLFFSKIIHINFVC
jgi:hypothetical protein